MNKINENLWTVENVAEYFRVKTSVVKYWLNYSDIPFIKIGKYIRFDRNEIKCWVEEHKKQNFILDRKKLQHINIDL